MAERAPAVPAIEVFKPKRRLPWYIECWPRLVKEKPLGTVGGVLVLLMLITGIFAPYIAPYGMNETRLADRLQPYSWKHPLGTDALGRDMLSRIIYGARISMFVGLGAVGISVIGKTSIGMTTGYFGRTGICELLTVDDETREQIMKRLGANLIKQSAVRKGMATLRDDGMARVVEGKTTLDEVLRVTQDDVI